MRDQSLRIETPAVRPSLDRRALGDNPVFVLGLGLCPSLAVTGSFINGVAIGCAMFVVLTICVVVDEMLRRRVPERYAFVLRLAAAAAAVTGIEAIMQAVWPVERRALGIYLPLLAVNCVVLAPARQSTGARLGSGLLAGAGYLGALALIALLREVFGNGTLSLGSGTAIRLGAFAAAPVRLIALPAGGLIVLGYLWALFALIRETRSSRVRA